MFPTTGEEYRVLGRMGAIMEAVGRADYHSDWVKARWDTPAARIDSAGNAHPRG